VTVIVALVTPEGAWMGSDSAVVYEGSSTVTSTPKTCRIGDFLIGYAGHFGACQSAVEWWRTTPNPSVQKYTKEVSIRGCSLLVIQRRSIYEIDDGGGLIRARKRNGIAYASIGSGFAPALGALYVDATDGTSVRKALLASAHHTTEVRPPFRVLSLMAK
jgi:20S proteasome alpha/beta subunit